MFYAKKVSTPFIMYYLFRPKVDLRILVFPNRGRCYMSLPQSPGFTRGY